MVYSLARLLLEHPSSPDEPLVCTIDRELTAHQFRRAAEAAAADLSALGVRPGEAVAVQLPSGPDIAAAMFGSWLAGAVFVPVNFRQPERELAHVVDAIKPAAFLGQEGLRRLDDSASYDPDVAFVMWTSGTTGPPKPILQTHSGYHEILGRVLASIRKGPSGPAAPPGAGSQGPSGPAAAPPGAGLRGPSGERPTPNLVPVSLSLNAGIYNLLFGLMAGASVVLMERFTPGDFASLVARYSIRSTVLPPAAMAMLTDAPEVTNLTPLRYVRSITAPLSPVAARRFMDKFGVTVLNGYGQAEVGEVIGWTAADARAHPEKLGALGRPHPGVDIKVVDDGGHPVGAGIPGDLLVRPPRIAAGYATGEAFADRMDDEGFVRTGDIAAVDDEGFVWLEGRATDLINRGGNKVFPDQVEEILRLVPGVKEAAVAGVGDPRLGEVPVAFVVGDVADEDLVAVCREYLVPYKVPVAFARVPAIPRSDVGKVLRRQLAAAWQQGGNA